MREVAIARTTTLAAAVLTVLAAFLPIVKDPSAVIIGQEITKEGAPSGFVSPDIAPGKDLGIGGQNFGPTPGKVLINGVEVVLGRSAADTKAEAAFG